MFLKLADGLKNNIYLVRKMDLPLKTAKRLEALGMTENAKITVLNKKKSAMIVEFRGTRFALSKSTAKNIDIETRNSAGGK